MKRFAVALSAAFAVACLVGMSPAQAQQGQRICFNTNSGQPQSCEQVTDTNPFPVDIMSSVLPSGAATAANQVLEIAALNTLIAQAITACQLTFCGLVTNPTASQTRPANSTPYSQNDLIANNTAAGSIIVPSIAIVNAAGGVAVPRVRLYTNVTTNWDSAAVTVRLWSSPPTYNNGDNGAYSVATGTTSYLGRFEITMTQNSDGAYGTGAPSTGTAVYAKLASGVSVYWDLQYTGASALTPQVSQTFTLQPELVN